MRTLNPIIKSLWKRLVLSLGLVVLVLSSAHAQQRLKAIKARGMINCGINQDLVGFSSKDPSGKWYGFEIDFCRALSAAIFNDPDKINFVPLLAVERFEPLRKKKVDIIVFQATTVMSRDNATDISFPVITYYDGQAFLTRKEHGFSSIKELDKATICLVSGTYDLYNLKNSFTPFGLTYSVKEYATTSEAFKAYEQRECTAITGDSSALYAIRTTALNPDDHAVLPEIISKEPISPVVLSDDQQWFRIIRWTHMAMLNAEEFAVTQSNVQAMLATSKNPAIRQLLGLDDDFGVGIGLSKDWAFRIIFHVGNYADAFDRNLGDDSPLKIKRGLNALWIKGGLQYGLPIR